MQQVLDYLDSCPMLIVGQKMYYKPFNQLSNKNRNLTELCEKLETLDFDIKGTSLSSHHAQVSRIIIFINEWNR